ncbi:MAG: transposase [Candidatus Berkiella sp.]
MTLARSEQINLEATPYYHVVNRCVRRSWLCGFDKSTNTDYSHRKAWIVDRLKYLADVFAIKICAYAIMSNHYHVVLHVDDKEAVIWTEDEVVRRWSCIFKQDAEKNRHLPSKINLWRERLTSISWYMRCLNEKIARDVNDEDDCSGRFWEGRFKSQALLDEAALLSAMVYVDLNPIRAGTAKTLETSEFTSIYERIQCISKQLKLSNSKAIKQKNLEALELNDKPTQPKTLVPFAHVSENSTNVIDFKLLDYLELVDYTGRVIRDDKQAGAIYEQLSPILTRLQFEPNNWVSFVKTIETQFSHAVGNEILLINFSNGRKKYLKGTSQAKKVYATL